MGLQARRLDNVFLDQQVAPAHVLGARLRERVEGTHAVILAAEAEPRHVPHLVAAGICANARSRRHVELAQRGVGPTEVA